MRDKLIAAMATVTLLSCAMTAALVHKPMRDSSRNRVRYSLMSAASTGALLVNVEEHSRLRPGDEATLRYSRIRRVLVNFRRANPGISEAYTMVKTSKPNVLRFVVDSTSPEDKNHDGKITANELPAKIGEPYDISNFPRMREAFVHPTADLEPTADKWGTWLSAYAPIRDRHGNVAAILGVDMTVSDLMAREHEAYWGLVRALAASLLGALLLALVLARRIVRPLQQLVEGAHQIKGGNLDFRVGIARNDELGRLAQAFDEMAVSLSCDALTGLHNRRYFHDRLIQELARSRRMGTALCVAALDLDGFKAINDSLGHQAGDEALRKAGAALSGTVRGYDVVARMGGDEFAVMLPETGFKEGLAATRKLLEAITAARIPAAPNENGQKYITASGGLACYPRDGTGAESLMLSADLAMLRSKHLARGTVSCSADLADAAAEFGPPEMHGLIQRATWTSLETLAALVDARAPHVRAHSDVVARYAVAVAQRMGLGPAVAEQAKAAGVLHDIGQITIPDSILNRPGALTPDEWDIVRQHPLLGSVIISKIPHLQSLVEPVRYHHEAFDGSGYPEGLKGEAIPMLARILAPVDAYEAMTSLRTYRENAEPLAPEQALEQLRSLSGKIYDPRVVEALIQVVQDELAEVARAAQGYESDLREQPVAA